MKHTILYAMLAFVLFSSCNNDTKDSVEKADSANEAKRDRDTSNTATNVPDAATSDFLVKAADGGLAEVKAGEMGAQKGSNARVRAFASMMVQDHTGANAKVKSLASARNVTLPQEPSDEHKQDADKVNQKTGKEFDRAFMDMMVSDHEKTIRLFEGAENDTKDAEVKSFITSTLPTLRAHLDSAKAVRKIVN